MSYFDALVLGILQGITEFLPVSSSGHLVLGEYYLELNVESLKSFDVIVHMGTFLAILIYFWKDIYGMLKVVFGVFRGRIERKSPYARLIFYILAGTIPAVIVGLLFEDLIDGYFRNVKAVGAWMLIVGLLFVLAEFVYKRRCGKEMTWWKALVVGVAQAFALIPGVSRSGSTIAAGLFQGISRESAARFSFLLGLPAMFGAGLLTFIKLPENGGFSMNIGVLLIGFFASFAFGLLSMSFLMRFLKRHSLFVFSIYLIALGLSVFVY